MNDKSALLGQLKIDRDAEAPRRRGWPWLLGAVVLGAAVAGGWWWWHPASALAVQAATAVAAGSGAARNGSVLDASGYVVARQQATVSSKVTGKVVELAIEEGMPVELGQVLARLDDANALAQLRLMQSQLEAARASVNEIRVQAAEAERQLLRSRELHAQGLVSDAARDNAQANVDALAARLEITEKNVQVADRGVAVARQAVDDMVVRAPFSGVITVKNAQVGEMISPLSAGGAGTRTGIGTLVNMKSLEIEVDVSENFINRVEPGQPVRATLNAYPDWTLPAKVTAVIPAADRSKATVRVRIEILEGDARILPDMGVRVSFLSEAAASAAETPKGVWVPSAALGDAEGQAVVWVIRDDTVEQRAVTVGVRRGDEVNVVGGLRAGERVATGDLAPLADGARIRLVETPT